MVRSPDGARSAAPSVRGSWIALAGLQSSALFLLAWGLLRGAPPFDASDDQLIAYDVDVIPLAGIAFMDGA